MTVSIIKKVVWEGKKTKHVKQDILELYVKLVTSKILKVMVLIQIQGILIAVHVIVLAIMK